MVNLFQEVDLIIMPPGSEGFGVMATLFPGLPVLVSGNSGIGEAFKEVPSSSQCVVASEYPEERAQKIANLREPNLQGRLLESRFLHKKYLKKKYSWEESCRNLEQRMTELASCFYGHQTTTSPPEFSVIEETANAEKLCRLLADVGTQALKDVFDAIHAPVLLHSVLTGIPVRAKLQSLKKKRVLSHAQWRKLYPAPPAFVSSARFDITVLMVLLRSICGLAPPITGWDTLPPVSDVTISANIARLIYYQTTLCKLNTVDDVTFSSYWQNISSTIVGLVGVKYEGAINNLKNRGIEKNHHREVLNEWKHHEDGLKENLEEMKGDVVPKKKGMSRAKHLEDGFVGEPFEAGFKNKSLLDRQVLKSELATPETVLKDFASCLSLRSMPQSVQFSTCLVDTHVPGKFVLSLYCYPPYLHGKVSNELSKYNVRYQGEDISTKPLCKGAKVLVDLVPSSIYRESVFLRFLGDGVFQSSGLIVSVDSKLVPQVEFKSLEPQKGSNLLCRVTLLPSQTF